MGDCMGNTNLTINGCVNIGTVTGNKNVGGIAGGPSGSSPKFNITESANYGMVIGEESVGGIAGGLITSSSIQNCLNTGVIKSKSPTNSCGIVGNNGGGNVSGCYYDKQMCLFGGINNGDIAGGAEGKLTSELCDGFNLSSSLWRPGSPTHTQYPYIDINLQELPEYRFYKPTARAAAMLCAYDPADIDKHNNLRRHFTIGTDDGTNFYGLT